MTVLPTTKPRIAIYTRISKDEHGTQLGVERQRAAINKMLDERYGAGNYTLVLDGARDEFSDNNISAWKRAKRPAYERLLQACRLGRVDAIAVWAVDRLYRRMGTLEEIIDVIGEDPTKGIDLMVVVMRGIVDLTTAAGRMTARIQAATAQYESDMKSERIKGQREQAAAAGQASPGGPGAYGYDRVYVSKADGVTLVVRAEEAKVLRFLAAEILAGASQGKAARRANEKGMRRRSGELWTGGDVRRALVKPTVAGLVHHLGETLGMGNWEPILDRATWESVRADLTDPVRRQKRTRVAPGGVGGYYLVGSLYSVEGRKLRGGRAGRGTAKAPGHYDRRVYKGGVTIDADAVEAFLSRLVELHLDLLTWEPPDTAEPTPEGNAITRLEARLNELAGEREEGELSKGEYLAARKVVQRKLDEARAAMPKRASSAAPRVTPANLAKRWNLPVERGGLTPIDKEEIIRWALGRVVIGPSPGGGKATPEHVASRIVSISGPVGSLATGDPAPARPGRGRTSSRRSRSA